jgi:hypothetical protein
VNAEAVLATDPNGGVDEEQGCAKCRNATVLQPSA